jgi:hypothetical protein
MSLLGDSVNSARSRSYAGGYGSVEPGPMGPGLGGFSRIGIAYRRFVTTPLHGLGLAGTLPPYKGEKKG